MSSDSFDQTEKDEQRATAFVFGELDGTQSAEFVQELRQSESLRSLVASIRGSVGVIEDELRQGADRLSSPARRKVLDAVMARSANDGEFDRDSLHEDNKDSDRQAIWNIALAIAASLLLICGLAMPALNQALATNQAQAELRQTIEDLQDKMEALADRNRLLESRLASDEGNRLPNAPSPDKTIETEAVVVNEIGSANPDKAVEAIETVEFPEALVAEAPSDESSEIVSSPPTRMPADDKTTPVKSRIDSEPDRQVDGIASDEMADQFNQRIVRAQLDPNRVTSRAKPDPEKPANEANDDDAFDIAMERAIDRSTGTSAIGKAPTFLSQLRKQYPAMPQRQFDQVAATLEQSLRDSNPFQSVHDNRFVTVDEYPLSQLNWSFAGGSFDQVRKRLMREQQFPSAGDVRIEELVNFFAYKYPSPPPNQDLSARVDVSDCPWNSDHRLARVVVQSRGPAKAIVPRNLVFLLDLSGSMNRAQKLPLVIAALKSIAVQLDSTDRIAIIPFAGPKATLLGSTPGNETRKIIDAIDSITTSRGTNGLSAFHGAFRIAEAETLADGVNQVIFCGDEGFRLDPDEEAGFAKAAAAADRVGVKLTMMHFGNNNVALSPIEAACRQAGGQFIAIDSERQAINEFWKTCDVSSETIAFDPAIQVEFNPAQAEAYRLIGFENGLRISQNLGETQSATRSVSAGESLTAFYEFVPRSGNESQSAPESDTFPLKYQQRTSLTRESELDELLSVTIRYAPPRSKSLVTAEFPGRDQGQSFEDVDSEFRFAASVVAMGMLLRESPHSGGANFQWAETVASESVADDPSGYRSEWIRMIRRAREIAGR